MVFVTLLQQPYLVIKLTTPMTCSVTGVCDNLQREEEHPPPVLSNTVMNQDRPGGHAHLVRLARPSWATPSQARS